MSPATAAIKGRRSYCYRVRMEATARYAAEHGFDSFTTSLLISPYQNHGGLAPYPSVFFFRLAPI